MIKKIYKGHKFSLKVYNYLTDDAQRRVPTSDNRGQSMLNDRTLSPVVKWNDKTACIKMAEQWDESIPFTERINFFGQVLEKSATMENGFSLCKYTIK